MGYQVSTYTGDAEHTIPCKGDAVVGDQVAFERATFSGTRYKPTFAGFELVVGTIVAESYGADKQQHTFTIDRNDGATLRIKGRNLYANELMRKPWQNESERAKVAAEKHQRGDAARAERATRIATREYGGMAPGR